MSLLQKYIYLAVKEFAMLALHADPDTALEEMALIPDVVTDIKTRWKLSDVIIMGDLNAGCSYASKSGLAKSPLKAAQYHWLISDRTDTTAGDSFCAYDR